MTSRVRVSVRSRPSPLLYPLIGLRAFDLVSSRVWWEAATNTYTPPAFWIRETACLIRPTLHLVGRWAAQTSRVWVSARYQPSPPLYSHFNRPLGFWLCVKSCLVGDSDKYLIHGTQTNTTNLGQIWSGSNGNEEVFHIPLMSRARISPSDSFKWYIQSINWNIYLWLLY